MVPITSLSASSYRLSEHAQTRMYQRGYRRTDLDLAIDYGRDVYTRDGLIFAIGRYEIEFWWDVGVKLDRLNGMQVVVSTDYPLVLTVYRNPNFRGLRSGMGRGRHTPKHLNHRATCDDAA